MVHGPQGTGSWKGNRDKHEKVPHNDAKKRDDWTYIGNKKDKDQNKKKDKKKK